MKERGRQAFDEAAVAKALGTKAQEVTDPAYGDGQHFQVTSDSTFLSLDAFPESGVSRITTKGARIELFGGVLPRVEDEDIVLRKDSELEHSVVALHPDGGMTFGYQVEAGQDGSTDVPVESPKQVVTSREAVETPAAEPEPYAEAKAPKPPEKPVRTPGAFPDVRPMTEVVSAALDSSRNDHTQPAQPQGSAVPSQESAESSAGDQTTKPETAVEADRQRVKLVGRLGRTPTVRETATGKLVAKFPLAVHLDDGTTKWHDVLAFNDRAAALKKRMEAGELVKGNEIEVVGYLHDREYQGRDGTTKTAQEIYSVAVKRH
ncbi:single-stranded DNA-binding protein [Streptomyces sp. NPDC059567]|uniref:single-stranded DNA-binding protein n=1 Tax=Streptomyces sp. NPDC059567 TaxID=3346867 RepID=UPI0036AC59F1